MTRYHKLLRVSALVFLFVLIFDAGFFSPVTRELSDATIVYLANSVGVFASVEENELNSITAALTERERELAEREAQLAEREIAVRDFDTDRHFDMSSYLLSVILFILTVLIVLNYALDFARVHKENRYERKLS